MDLLAVAGALGQPIAGTLAAEGDSTGITINLFWVIVAAANFLVFFAAAWLIFFKPVSGRLVERRLRLETGLRDAEAARQEREQAALDRMELIAEARREANEIMQRAQKAAEESRERDIAATRVELGRLKAEATAEIEAEKLRAVADVRAEVADLALRAAARVVGETMTAPREQRIVQQFLAELDAQGRH